MITESELNTEFEIGIITEKFGNEKEENEFRSYIEEKVLFYNNLNQTSRVSFNEKGKIIAYNRIFKDDQIVEIWIECLECKEELRLCFSIFRKIKLDDLLNLLIEHWRDYHRILRNQTIGINIQELIAVLIEKELQVFNKKQKRILKKAKSIGQISFFKPPSFLCFSNGTRNADLYLADKKNTLLEGEVKSALEKYYVSYKNKKTGKVRIELRRGMFNVLPDQLNHDFFVFVVRFVDVLEDECIWNGDYEIFYALGKDVRNYLEKQTLNCENYKLNIDKLPLLNVKQDFMTIFRPLMDDLYPNYLVYLDQSIQV